MLRAMMHGTLSFVMSSVVLVTFPTASIAQKLYGTDIKTAHTVGQVYVDQALGGGVCTTYHPTSGSCGGGTALAYGGVTAAVQAAKQGQTILLRKGTYGIAALGLHARTLAAYNDEPVQLHGCVTLGGNGVLDDVTVYNSVSASCDDWRSSVAYDSTANGARVRNSTILSCDGANCAGINVNRGASNTVTQGNHIVLVPGATSSAFRGYSADGTQFLDNRVDVLATTAQEGVQFGSSMENAPRCGAPMRVLRNHFGENLSENHLDWKGTLACNQTIEWAYNMHESIGTGHLLIKGTPQGGHTETWQIHDNVFQVGSGKGISLSDHSGCEANSGLQGPLFCNTFTGAITKNLFLCGPGGEAIKATPITQGNYTIAQNTFAGGCDLKLAQSPVAMTDNTATGSSAGLLPPAPAPPSMLAPSPENMPATPPMPTLPTQPLPPVVTLPPPSQLPTYTGATGAS